MQWNEQWACSQADKVANHIPPPLNDRTLSVPSALEPQFPHLQNEAQYIK